MSQAEFFVLARKNLGLTQQQLADELGLTSRQVSSIENGADARKQTLLAVECLLRRKRKWSAFSQDA